jgi:transposase
VLAGVSRPTVDLWLSRYDADGIAGLFDQVRGAGREQVPASVRARILALTRASPPVGVGLVASAHRRTSGHRVFVTNPGAADGLSDAERP